MIKLLLTTLQQQLATYYLLLPTPIHSTTTPAALVL